MTRRETTITIRCLMDDDKYEETRKLIQDLLWNGPPDASELDIKFEAGDEPDWNDTRRFPREAVIDDDNPGYPWDYAEGDEGDEGGDEV